MDSWKVALIDQTGVVPVASLQQFAAALQQQTDDDLAPAWNVRADISVLSAHENIPAGTWPINIVSSLNGGGGVHLDDQGQVYANVANDDPASAPGIRRTARGPMPAARCGCRIRGPAGGP